MSEQLHHERIRETSHLVSIPVYGATCHSLCSRPNYPRHKTAGTGRVCYCTRSDANTTEITLFRNGCASSFRGVLADRRDEKLQVCLQREEKHTAEKKTPVVISPKNNYVANHCGK